MDERRERRRGPGLVGPVILIGLGVVFLLNNLGIVSWSVWEIIFRFWPILLVAAGLDLLVGRRSVWGSLLALVLTVAFVAGVLWLFNAGLIPGQGATGEQISLPLQEATSAKIVLSPAVGSIHVNALPESANLVEGTIYLKSGERVARDFVVAGGKATLTLKSEGSFTMVAVGWSDRGWDLGLNSGVPLALEVTMGVGESVLDLTGLQVRNLNVSLGMGQIRVTLPAAGHVQARISGGIGETVVVIPAGMEARIRVDAALSAHQVPAGYVRQGDVYVSPGYEGAENRVDLEVSHAIGNVSIR
jgi:hypothetical protein